MACIAGSIYRRDVSAPIAAAQPIAVRSGAVDPSLNVAAPTEQPVRRLMDAAGFVDSYNAERMEDYLGGVYDETGVDIRFVFEREVPGDLEQGL